MGHHRRLLFALPALFIGAACGVPDRAAGDRTPLSATCDPASELRCMLPWPSNTYTVVDENSPTGLRVDIEQEGLFVRDDVSFANTADGFSRAIALLTGFPTPLGEAEGTVKLLVGQADRPDHGSEVPVWTYTEEDEGESLLGANPYGPLEPNTDYVAVVTRDLLAADGSALEPSRHNLLALDLAEPENEDEERVVAYHAPTRATLAAAGIALEDVLVVWEFTTRSADNPTRPVVQMIEIATAAVDETDVTVDFDTIEVRESPPSVKVVGHLRGVPSFLNPDNTLAVGANGQPRVTGKTDALFRMVIPTDGEGDYRVVMYGHGTGGSHDDDILDAEVLRGNAAKVGFPWLGWTGPEVADTWFGFESMFAGVHRSSSRLAQAMSQAAAIQRALAGVLGDELAKATLVDGEGNTVDNPLAGKRPNLDIPLYAGGSLGGAMGLTYSSAHPDIHHGVLNVPGAGWSQWIQDAETYGLIRLLLKSHYTGSLNLIHAAKMSQLNWDLIDGSAYVHHWRAKEGTFVVQSSYGDPVLPNPGSYTVALCADAVQLGEVLVPVPGIETAEEAVGRSAYTQFRVPDDWGELEVHGFAKRTHPSGDGAREQIFEFIESVYEGAPRITLPSQCVDNGGSCDFSMVE